MRGAAELLRFVIICASAVSVGAQETGPGSLGIPESSTQAILRDFLLLKEGLVSPQADSTAFVQASGLDQFRGGAVMRLAGLSVRMDYDDADPETVIKELRDISTTAQFNTYNSVMQGVWDAPTYLEIRNGVVPAIASITFTICNSIRADRRRGLALSAAESVQYKKRCNAEAYGILARLKGDLAEAISKRPRAFIEGAEDSADVLRYQGAPDFPSVARAATEIQKLNIFDQAGYQALVKRAEAGDKKAYDEVVRMATEYTDLISNGAIGKLVEASTVAPARDGSALRFLTNLNSNEAFIDIYRFRPRIARGFGPDRYLAVVSRSSADSDIVDLGPAAPFDQATRTFTDTINKAGLPMEQSWAELRKTVWLPIRRLFPRGVNQIILAPDGPLNEVPWTALSNDSAEGAAPLLTVVQGAFQLARRSRPFEPGDTTLLVGGFDFGDGTLGKLDGAEAELREVAKIATSTGRPGTSLVGEKGTIDAILNALPKSRFAHFASHAMVNDPGTGKFSFDTSGVALNGANGGGEGTILSAKALLPLDLRNMELLVLAACQGATGRSTDGQGVLGFQTAFMATGLRSLLAPLWRIPDQATGSLMVEFYRNLWQEKMSKAAALRLAQRKVQKTNSDIRAWGAWQLISDGN